MSEEPTPSKGTTAQTAESPRAETAPPSAGPSTPAVAKPPEIDFTDYLSHQVAQKAKKEVLAYFGLATVVVSVLVTLIGWQEMKQLLESRYEALVKERAAAANARVNALQKDFEDRLRSLRTKAEQETEEHSLLIASVRSQITTAVPAAGDLIDLSATIGPVGNQGAEGTTVGFALSYAMNSLWITQRPEQKLFSPRSIYIAAKQHDEFPGADYEGTSLSGGVKALQTIGAMVDSDWPYSQKSSPARRAARYTANHQRLKTTSEIVQAIKKRQVVAVSFTISEEFNAPSPDGKVILRPGSPSIGGHAVTIVGWDEKTREFKFANMWGTDWGARGFGYIRESDLATILVEAYTLHF